MLIAFIAFVVCFELPRDDRFYPINEAGALGLVGEITRFPVASNRSPPPLFLPPCTTPAATLMRALRPNRLSPRKGNLN
jgi:hypothetical protein